MQKAIFKALCAQMARALMLFDNDGGFWDEKYEEAWDIRDLSLILRRDGGIVPFGTFFIQFDYFIFRYDASVYRQRQSRRRGPSGRRAVGRA